MSVVAYAVVDCMVIPLYDALERRAAYQCRYCAAVARYEDRLTHGPHCPYVGAKTLLSFLFPTTPIHENGPEDSSGPPPTASSHSIPETAAPDRGAPGQG